MKLAISVLACSLAYSSAFVPQSRPAFSPARLAAGDVEDDIEAMVEKELGK